MRLRSYLGRASATCIAFAASASSALPLRDRLVKVGLLAVAWGRERERERERGVKARGKGNTRQAAPNMGLTARTSRRAHKKRKKKNEITRKQTTKKKTKIQHKNMTENNTTPPNRLCVVAVNSYIRTGLPSRRQRQHAMYCTCMSAATPAVATLLKATSSVSSPNVGSADAKA